MVKFIPASLDVKLVSMWKDNLISVSVSLKDILCPMELLLNATQIAKRVANHLQVA